MPDEYVYTPPALMSLSNPDTVVTEERLAQFYQQILPYMGGMPDVLANKFSKADLYSTDEKLIGRWIDGKPLYQKVIVDTTPLSGSSLHIDLSSDNADFIRPLYIAMAATSGGSAISYTPLNFNNSSSYLFYINEIGNHDIAIAFSANLASNRGNHGYVAIVQYTKTTDSAVEIGDDTDYSTTEKIVGTWIDGKPIWQKTIEISNPSNSWSPVTLSSLGIENSELVFKVGSATFITSTGDIIGEHCFGNTSFATCMVADNSSGSSSASHCLWFKWSTTSTMSKAIVTLQYTKTSS